MTQGITLRTPAADLRRPARPAPVVGDGVPASGVLERARAAARAAWRWWPRWLPELPDSLVDDVAPGRRSPAVAARWELNRLDARLGVRLY
ncbi:MAG: hypothetical protein HZB48_06710 [Actinobacteria bacterium]|nr:hypothetical protein [Actinomycetota bacterium]